MPFISQYFQDLMCHYQQGGPREQFYGTFSTNRLNHAKEVGNISHRAGENTKIMQLNNERIQ